MNYFDLFCVFVLAVFAAGGFGFGFVHMVGAIVGIALSTVIASHTYAYVGGFLTSVVNMNGSVADIGAFLVAFILANRVCGLLLMLLDKSFNVIAIIPFTKTFNRMLGAALGLIEGAAALGLCIFLAGKLPWSNVVDMVLQNSKMASPLAAIGALLAPLFPLAVRKIQSFL